MNQFENGCIEIMNHVNAWEERLLTLDSEVITERRNNQSRNIKQILGHVVDSASNNTHRIIHMQYQKSPCIYPDYANLGNNDRWIAIQNYNDEDFHNLVRLWKYINIHLVHVIRNVNEECIHNEWITALNRTITLEEMIFDYPRHLEAHLQEIEELLLAKGV